MSNRKNRRKRAFALLVALCLCLAAAAGCAEETIDLILSTGTTQAFTKETVPEADMTRILEAGLSAASAMNTQPWQFVVVTNPDVIAEINAGMSFGGAPAGMPGEAADGNAPAAPPAAVATGTAKAGLGDSPVAILIYMDESNAMGNASFDCGLSCQSMVIAAGALGYGTKIVSSPTMALNGDNHDALCEKLGVDSSLKAVAVLLLGKADSAADGVAGATTRSPLADKVCFVK